MEEKSCWICFISSSEDSIAATADSKWIHPCKCRGSTRWVHQDCLLKWLKSSSRVGGNLFRYGASLQGDSVSIRNPHTSDGIFSHSSLSRSLFGRTVGFIQRAFQRFWDGGIRQVVTISSKFACPQCKTPYIITQNENSWTLTFLEKLNYFGSKTLTMFVYCSLIVGGFSILWVHGAFSLIFLYGIEDYAKIFPQIVINDETLSEENIFSTFTDILNYFSFTLVAIPMIPLFLIVSVLPINTFRHAISIILMGRMYLFTNLNGDFDDQFQLSTWLVPFAYVSYSYCRDYLFSKLGISKKIAERQLAATTEAIAESSDEDENSLVAAVILESSDDSSEDDAGFISQLNQPNENHTSDNAEDPPSNNNSPSETNETPNSPLQTTVRTIATIRSSITPIISALFMPFFIPSTRILLGAIFNKLVKLPFPVIYKNLISAALFILIKDLFQVTYHLERDRLEKSRSILNYNLPSDDSLM